MAIDAVTAGLRIMPADVPSAATTPAASKTFGEALGEAVGEVDTLNLDARHKVSSLVEGNGADVHDAMIAVEKADLSFQLMLQVRNKVVQAYQQIAGMQF